MADFCQQCSIDVFGEDFEDFVGLAPEGEVVEVLCEGCGYTLVNHRGQCVMQDCLEQHACMQKEKP